MNNNQPENAKSAALKSDFYAAQSALIAAANGLRGDVSDSELVELRRTVMQTRAACMAQGVEVESLEEYAQKSREFDTAHIRSCAEKLSQRAPRVPYRLRRQIAGATGCIIGAVILSRWPTAGGILGAFLGGFAVFTLVEEAVAKLFPTPSVIIAKMACARGIDVSDLWPEGSDEFKDYIREYRHAQFRGESPGWIKIR